MFIYSGYMLAALVWKLYLGYKFISWILIAQDALLLASGASVMMQVQRRFLAGDFNEGTPLFMALIFFLSMYLISLVIGDLMPQPLFFLISVPMSALVSLFMGGEIEE
ncbi:MAG: hypothetical protein DRO11_00160 [Methanobacteriota archaeon]|nr:MAG: hypothetical protein DRO11_00160 [Euryarchaeota archaeon]